jgi:hypothetical protein
MVEHVSPKPSAPNDRRRVAGDRQDMVSRGAKSGSPVNCTPISLRKFRVQLAIGRPGDSAAECLFRVDTSYRKCPLSEASVDFSDTLRK